MGTDDTDLAMIDEGHPDEEGSQRNGEEWMDQPEGPGTCNSEDDPYGSNKDTLCFGQQAWPYLSPLSKAQFHRYPLPYFTISRFRRCSASISNCWSCKSLSSICFVLDCSSERCCFWAARAERRKIIFSDSFR